VSTFDTPAPQRGFDWGRAFLPTARLFGLLLLDAAVFLVALAVLLTVGVAAIDYLILLWRR